MEHVDIALEYDAKERIESPIFSFEVVRADGVVCCSSRTDRMGIKVPSIKGKGKVRLDLGKNLLAPGIYMAKFSIWDKEMIHPYVMRTKDVIRIEIDGQNKISDAVFLPDITWEF